MGETKQIGPPSKRGQVIDAKSTLIPLGWIAAAVITSATLATRYQVTLHEMERRIQTANATQNAHVATLQLQINGLDAKTQGRWTVGMMDRFAHEWFILLKKFHPELGDSLKPPDAFTIKQ